MRANKQYQHRIDSPINNRPQLSNLLQIVRAEVLDAIFPRICVGCSELLNDGRNICSLCHAQIRFQDGFVCAFCRAGVVNGRTCPFCRQDHALDQLLVATSYEQPIMKRAIKAFKYGFVRDLGSDLSQLLLEYLERVATRDSINLDNTAIVAVPLARSRLRWRGFNQAEILAKEIALKTNLALITPLQRIRQNRPQAEITDKAIRIANIQDAFLCKDMGSIKDKNILLVDDLSTTGSTLDACARTLKTAGAKHVSALVLARAI